ncbi:MAG: carbohydrate kinase family protein [Desulfovibrio sp.]
MNIYISGSMAFDRISNFPGSFADHILADKIHMLNVCFLVDGLEERFGGTAGNVAYSLALLGKESTILSAVGKDFGPYATRLEEYNISQDGIRIIEDEFTAGAYITTDEANNQITSFNPGAMKYGCDFTFPELNGDETYAIIAPGNLDDMIGFAKYYRENKIPFIFDPGQQIPVFSGEQMLEAITDAAMLISNDYELEMIMKNTGKMKEELLTYCKVIVTTLGEEGCVINNGAEIKVGSVKLDKVVDPTGAGDSFRSGFLAGLADGKDLEDSAKIGAVTASYCVEKMGTQGHAFTADEFKARYEGTFGPLK